MNEYFTRYSTSSNEEIELEREMRKMADILSFEYYDFKLKQLASKIKFQSGQTNKLKAIGS